MLSGLNTTGHEIGGSLGIAVLASLATSALGPGAAASGISDAYLAPRRSRRSRAWRRSSSCPPRRHPAQAALTPHVAVTDAHHRARNRTATPPRRRRAQPRGSWTRHSTPSRAIPTQRRRVARRRAWCAPPSTCTPTRDSLSAPSGSARSTKLTPRSKPPSPSAATRSTRFAAFWRPPGANSALPRPNRHRQPAPTGQTALQAHSVLAGLEPLLVRGRANGSFRFDVPASWQLSMLMALIHAASAELQAARVDDRHAEDGRRHRPWRALRPGRCQRDGPSLSTQSSAPGRLRTALSSSVRFADAPVRIEVASQGVRGAQYRETFLSVPLAALRPLRDREKER